MLVLARYLAFCPNLTPVAMAVCSLTTLRVSHCLQRYTRTSDPATARKDPLVSKQRSFT